MRKLSPLPRRRGEGETEASGLDQAVVDATTSVAAGTMSPVGATQDRTLTLMHLRKMFSEYCKVPLGGSKDNEQKMARMLPLFAKVMKMYSAEELATQFKELAAFTGHLSRLFVQEIRLRASNQSTEEAAVAIADFLQPQLREDGSETSDDPDDATFSRGWLLLTGLIYLVNTNHLAAIEAACKAALPSTLAKALYLFFDLPPIAADNEQLAKRRQALHTHFVDSQRTSLCSTVLDVINSIYSADPANYFILDKECALGQFAEHIYTKEKSVQLKFFELLEYVVFHLNHIPCKEFIALCVVLKTQALTNTESCILCVQSCFRILSFNLVLRDAFREVGLLEVLTSMTMQFSERIRAAEAIDLSQQEKTLALLAIDMLTMLMKGNAANARVFRECGGSKCAQDLIPSDAAVEWRPSLLQLMQQLLMLPGGDEDLSALLVILHTSPPEQLALKTVVLKFDEKNTGSVAKEQLVVILRACNSLAYANCVFLPSISPVLGSAANALANSDGIGGGVGSGERIFPPLTGLSFSAWIYVERFSDKRKDSHPLRLLTVTRTMPQCSAPEKLNRRSSTLSEWFGGDQSSGSFNRQSSDGAVSPGDQVELSCLTIQLSPIDRALLIATFESDTPGADLDHDSGPADSFMRIAVADLMEALNADAVKLMYRLGAQYSSSYQTPSFGTSTTVSPPLLSEERLAFGVSALAVSQMTISKLRRIYSKVDCRIVAKHLGISTNENATPIRILHNTAGNLAGPARTLGGVLIGYLGMRTFCPCPVARLLESVGGISSLFGLVAMANDSEGLYASLKALLCAIRNNDAIALQIQASRGYQTLAMLLEEKCHLLNSHILHLVFALTGTLDSARRSSTTTLPTSLPIAPASSLPSI
uniref:Uncharacterized protein n=1 Tax=Plectus sambesii TaxID=2011161 RepID=A0A914V8R9_9BILA